MLQVFFNEKLEDCYETVIAAMASHIEHLQGEIRYKQRIIDQLEELLNKKAQVMPDTGDLDKDPFDHTAL